MIAKDLGDREIVDKVFSVAKKAKEAMLEYGDSVIDATIGSLYDEEGKLVVLNTAMEIYRELPPEDITGYASNFTGTPEYKESVKISLFGRDYEKFLSGHHCEVIATPGGSGAISTSIRNYLGYGDTILLPKWLWSPYILMAKDRKGSCEFYEMFNNKNEFDIADLKERVERLSKIQENVVLIINDPCQNPTGYRLTIEEWQRVREILVDCSKRANVIVIVDIAYIDFDDREFEEKREFLEIFKNLPERVLTIFTFSLSKSLTCYGLRVGAQIALTTSETVIKEFVSANSYTCRATWSNISRGGMAMFSKLISDTEKTEKLRVEREQYRDLIVQRAEIFIREARECGLDILPYVSGFFLTIPTGEYTAKMEELLEKNHIYTVILDEGIRIALCSVPKRKIEGLAFKIKELLECAKQK